jgi:hypothetical protein
VQYKPKQQSHPPHELPFPWQPPLTASISSTLRALLRVGKGSNEIRGFVLVIRSSLSRSGCGAATRQRRRFLGAAEIRA